jgi:hypothetical protein
MKKAFDQNVSRAKPRLRLGAAFAELAPTDTAFAQEVMEAPRQEAQAPDLSAQVKARAEKARAPRPTASEAVQRALGTAYAEAPETEVQQPAPYTPTSRVATPIAFDARPTPDQPSGQSFAHASVRPPVHAERSEAQARGLHSNPASFEPSAPAPMAYAAPPPAAVEVQTPAAPQATPEVRRERLKERLQAVRENPRPEPLPPTVAEAGVLAVERIATLQAELSKVKTINLALTQDLESARRQAERATEEARLRMDEARRLSTEMEERAKLLADLEHELSSLEGERDEALLSLQESRQTLEANSKERDALKVTIAERDQSLADSLSEEERLAGELESVHDDAQALRRALDALKTERDTFARQVGDLTVERADLLEARKALQAVHKALSHAVVR